MAYQAPHTVVTQRLHKDDDVTHQICNREGVQVDVFEASRVPAGGAAVSALVWGDDVVSFFGQ